MSKVYIPKSICLIHFIVGWACGFIILLGIWMIVVNAQLNEQINHQRAFVGGVIILFGVATTLMFLVVSTRMDCDIERP